MEFAITSLKKTGRPESDFPPADTWMFFTEQWGITLDEYIDWANLGVAEQKIFWKGPQIENALWGVSELYRLGYYIKFITARGGGKPEPTEQCRRATKYWLDSNGFPYDEVIVSYDKTSYDYDILIDDSPGNYESCVADGKNILVFDQAWNRHLTDAPRAMDWIEVVKYITTHYPLKASVRETV
jgi:hypothetical protein